MAIQKILCPIDFSAQSQAALDYAVSIARDANAELCLIHVVEPIVEAGQVAPVIPEVEEFRGQLNEIAIDPGIRTRRRVVVGFPAEKIIAISSNEHADLIVMGTHGRTGLSRLLMGSVAERVVRRAPCPVLTLKSAVPVDAASK